MFVWESKTYCSVVLDYSIKKQWHSGPPAEIKKNSSIIPHQLYYRPQRYQWCNPYSYQQSRSFTDRNKYTSQPAPSFQPQHRAQHQHPKPFFLSPWKETKAEFFTSPSPRSALLTFLLPPPLIFQPVFHLGFLSSPTPGSSPLSLQVIPYNSFTYLPPPRIILISPAVALKQEIHLLS